MHYEISIIKIASPVCSVCLFKEINTLKKKSYWDNTERLYFTHMGEDPSKAIVTKYGLWVPLPDVINGAKSYLYHANSFWVAEPRKMGVLVDLRGDIYNS